MTRTGALAFVRPAGMGLVAGLLIAAFGLSGRFGLRSRLLFRWRRLGRSFLLLLRCFLPLPRRCLILLSGGFLAPLLWRFLLAILLFFLAALAQELFLGRLILRQHQRRRFEPG